MMPSHLSPRLGVSTWSLHHRLTDRNVPLQDIPAEVAAHGLGKLEICHFHLPSTDDVYLADLRAAIDTSGVELFTLLIDTGDLTAADPQKRAEDEVSIARWLDIAARLGAARARVIAGNATPGPNGDALAVSAAALGRLARHAEAGGVRLVTENWHALLDRPAEVLALLDKMQGEVGLKLDFGNWQGARKYDDLARIAPLAECTHAKAAFPQPGQMDREDFTRCLEICRAAGFTGPHILIYDSGGDEWASLDQMREAVLPCLSS